MNSLPIVIREMRVAARKPWIIRTRLTMALVGIATWLFIFAAGPARASDKGHALLAALSGIAMISVLLSGVFLTADCLSEEKREGTIGLLFLTPLKAYDVVLGKLVANAAVAFFGLLAILPILCLPLLTGGVTWAETLRVMLSLVLALALSLAIGMFVSSKATDSRNAFIATLIAVILLAVLPLLVAALREIMLRRTVPDSLFSQLSPIYTLMFAFESNFNRFTSSFYWRSVALVVLVTLVLLFAACRVIRTSWQIREQAAPSRAKAKADTHRKIPRLPFPKDIVRSRDLYAWLSFRGSSFGRGAPWFLRILTVFWFLMLAFSGGGRRNGGQQLYMIAMFTAFAIHAIMKAIFALEATRQIHQDVRSGNLQLLLGTPLLDRDIIAGQVQACRKLFLGPLILLTCLNLMMELSIFVFYQSLSMREVAVPFSVFFIGGILALYLDCWAIQWVGIWKSVQAQTHLKATFATLKSVFGLPWILFPMLFAIAVNQRGVRIENVMAGVMSCWFLFGYFVNLILIRGAKRQLRRRFRETVAQRGG